MSGVLEQQESAAELKHGHITPLSKQPKPCTTSSTRPLVVLTMSRKVMSRIVLGRVKEDVERHLSPGQHANRKGRSTSEAVLAVQWVCAAAERARVMSADLSKALDCLSRPKLMATMRESGIGRAGEERMTGYLLSETKLVVELEGKLGKLLPTETGTPQGDSLSPILFLAYLEHILRSYPRQDLVRSSRSVETSCADGVVTAMREEAREVGQPRHEYRDVCTCMSCGMETLERTLPAQFARYDMQVNAGKAARG